MPSTKLAPATSASITDTWRCRASPSAWNRIIVFPKPNVLRNEMSEIADSSVVARPICVEQ